VCSSDLCGREVYTMSVAEVLEHLDAVVAQAQAQGSMPALPVLD
jgi:fructose-specific component phosphotransferase system IIB-like protein